MLREATSASNDDARLDDTETVPDDMNLGAELDGAPPEVRAAAVRWSSRIPELGTIRPAWLSLPAAVRDQIGLAAFTHAFYSSETIAGENLMVTLEAGRRTEEWACEALGRVEALATAALPEFFGTPEAEPLWALRDGVAVVYPAETHPSPLTLAIADHLKAERDFAAVLGRPAEDPERMALEAAEEAARQAVIAVQPRDRADLVALYEHLSYDCGEPAEEPLARALDALALALQLGEAA